MEQPPAVNHLPPENAPVTTLFQGKERERPETKSKRLSGDDLGLLDPARIDVGQDQTGASGKGEFH
jgi:hypothetical protein